MVIAGARCDCCGRVDTIPYTSATAVKVLLAQKGWVFSGGDSMCRICVIKENDKKVSCN